MQELTVSRITELKKEIAAIAQCPKAGEETATKAALALVAIYPNQQNSDPLIARAFMRQMTNLLVGQDLDVLNAMLDAKSELSLVRKFPKFRPSVPEVAEWIDWKMEPKRSRIGWYLDEIKAIERRDEEESISPEERARRADMLRNVSKVIEETARATQRASPPLKAWQATEWEAQKLREEGLKNLDAMRGN